MEKKRTKKTAGLVLSILAAIMSAAMATIYVRLHHGFIPEDTKSKTGLYQRPSRR